MTWFDWTLIGWWLFGAVMFQTQVGKPRKPIEPGAAAVYLVIVAALIVGLLASRGVL